MLRADDPLEVFYDAGLAADASDDDRAVGVDAFGAGAVGGDAIGVGAVGVDTGGDSWDRHWVLRADDPLEIFHDVGLGPDTSNGDGAAGVDAGGAGAVGAGVPEDASTPEEPAHICGGVCRLSAHGVDDTLSHLGVFGGLGVHVWTLCVDV